MYRARDSCLEHFEVNETKSRRRTVQTIEGYVGKDWA